MEELFLRINSHWHWLGPWLVFWLGLALILHIVDFFEDLNREIREYKAESGKRRIGETEI